MSDIKTQKSFCSDYTGTAGTLGEGGRIEVLVQSLDGICIDKESNQRPSLPWVTATVAFSGSASIMKVGSSSVCGITGQLLVESEPVTIRSSELLSRPKSPRLSAQWIQEQTDGETQPHLTMQFGGSGKEGPKKSLEEGNRGAKFVKRDLEISQTASTVTESTSSTAGNETLEESEEDEDRSRSAVWADTGETMPEIIEMYIRLRHDHDTTETLWDGVAFLVVYGHELDSGTHCLELPIQKPSIEKYKSSSGSSLSSRGSFSKKNTRMSLSDSARLTVQVKVTPCRPTSSTPVASSIVAAGSVSSTEVALSKSAMEAELQPLIEKLQQHEHLAKKMCENQKRAMDVNVPSHSPDEPLPRPPPSRDGYCHVPLLGQWASFLTRMASMAVHCNANVAQPHHDDYFDQDENSTIATSDSLRLFTR